MIEDHDRSGWFGASDTDKVIGNWNTETFKKWWLQKMGVDNSHFNNRYTAAGTHYEHRILESIGIPMELDRQVIIEELLLRVNLDGNDDTTIYECKTFIWEKGFKLPRKYVNQVQVQMYATGLRRAKIVAYGLLEEDYGNFFREIDPQRLQIFDIEYDERWIHEKYLPKLTYLAECLREWVYPRCA